jgi:hypothetical protein
MKKLFALAAFLALACYGSPALAQAPQGAREAQSVQGIPMPPNLKHALDAKTPDKILSSFLGIGFRVDGAIDEHGKYTLFTNPGTIFAEPGVNCSGFLLAASRLLLQKNITLAAAMRDRLGDSGAGAAMGQDWDFGWDLILNITDGSKRALLLPGGGRAAPAAGSGVAPRGFALHSQATWQELPSRIRPNHLYFVAFSRQTTQRGYSLLHYHVGIMLRTSEKDWHLYHSIKKSGVVRENLGNEQNRAKFLITNADVGGTDKHMFIVEVPISVAFGS